MKLGGWGEKSRLLGVGRGWGGLGPFDGLTVSDKNVRASLWGQSDRAGVLNGPLELLGFLWGLQCLHWSRHFPPILPANI